ncbi:hypothetical protein J4Q44_G00285050 [Coregonus suidteri]|uniref:Uncharacterized protein n=1 Tax=Coregonus suidteri TaxID=861788 RepID=A0AAN8KWY7_9TELE
MRRHTTYDDEDLRDATRRKGEKVPDDKLHEPTIYSFRTQEQDIAATGFQRFLNVLNKGVDINKFSKIVNNVNELPPMQEGHSKTTYRSEIKGAPAQSSQDCLGPHSRALPQDHSHSHIRGERRPGLPHGQLQSLLESIGLDLGVEELGRLSDRTKERLPNLLEQGPTLKEPSHPRCLQYVKTVVPKGGNRRVRRLIKSRVKRKQPGVGERCKKYRKEVLRKRRIYRDLQEKRDGLIARAAAKVGRSGGCKVSQGPL